MNKLLPEDFNDQITSAVKYFWESRLLEGSKSQEGGRGSVISGKNMDGFTEVIRNIALHCGLPEGSIITKGKKKLTVPGYFRPTKMWDAVIIYKGMLLASFELKSQVGSFGNNFNNRSEESIGSANDFWTAYREKAFSPTNCSKPRVVTSEKQTIMPPFLAYLMLLEECEGSGVPVKVEEEHYKVFPVFRGSSYMRRYQLLCERLVLEGLYSASCLLYSQKDTGYRKGLYTSPADTLSPKYIFAEFAAKLIAAKEIFG